MSFTSKHQETYFERRLLFKIRLRLSFTQLIQGVSNYTIKLDTGCNHD